MATLQELESALINADRAGDADAARKLAAVITIARQDKANLIPDAQIPGTIPQAPEPTLTDRAVGAAETGAALLTGATTGMVGGAAGAVKTIAGQILSGEFGTPEAANLAEQAAQRGAQALTYAPRTQAGQQMTQAAGETLAQVLPPVVPVATMPGAIAQSIRQAAPITAATAARGAQAAQAGMQAAGRVAKQTATKPVQAVRQMIAPAAEEAGATGAQVSMGAAATPETLKRVTTAENLPAPVTLTRGAATRDAMQLAFEKEQMKSELGGPLRNRIEENNLQALQNFEALIDMTDAQTGTHLTAGDAVLKALSDGFAAAKNRTRAAYKEAEKAGELQSNVKLDSVIGYINENIPEGDLAPVLRAARQKAIAIGAAVPDEAGNLVAQPVTLAQAENLRKTFQRAGFEGADMYHGSALRRVFDAETEGMGGDLYKAARATRAEQARKFENRAIVARLIKNRKGMADPMVAADQVFRKSVLTSSPEEITFLKRVLKTTGPDGQQAWKELQGATVRHLRDEATKGMGMDSFDRPIVSPAKLNQAVRALDENGRLDLMLGTKNAQLVRDLNDVVKYVQTVPPGTLVNSSGTAGTLLAAIAEAGATGALTGLPLPVATGIRQIIKMRHEKRTKARINDALNALPSVEQTTGAAQ